MVSLLRSGSREALDLFERMGLQNPDDEDDRDDGEQSADHDGGQNQNEFGSLPVLRVGRAVITPTIFSVRLVRNAHRRNHGQVNSRQ
jgi:hypothetical protein